MTVEQSCLDTETCLAASPNILKPLITAGAVEVEWWQDSAVMEHNPIGCESWWQRPCERKMGTREKREEHEGRGR